MPPRQYDAVVVGARCAGAATALLLARAGLRVLLADRGAFPSEIPHGHFIHRHGPARLQRRGLLDRVVASGCPPVDTWRTDLGDGPVEGTGLVVDGVAGGYGPRHAVLDTILVEAAVAAGAELRERWVVEEVTRDGDRVTGVRGRSLGGSDLAAERASSTVVPGASRASGSDMRCVRPVTIVARRRCEPTTVST